MAVYKTGVDAFQLAISGDGAAPNVAARKATHDSLIAMTQRLAAFLELSADGNLVKLAATGLELKTKPVASRRCNVTKAGLALNI